MQVRSLHAESSQKKRVAPFSASASCAWSETWGRSTGVAKAWWFPAWTQRKKKWIGISYTFPRESLCFEDLEKKHVFVILTHTHTQIASDFQHICRYQISSGAISKPCGSCPARAAFKGKPIGTSWHKPSAGDSSHRSKWFVFKIRTFTMIWHQKWSSTQRCLGLLGCLAFDFCILSY